MRLLGCSGAGEEQRLVISWLAQPPLPLLATRGYFCRVYLVSISIGHICTFTVPSCIVLVSTVHIVEPDELAWASQ